MFNPLVLDAGKDITFYCGGIDGRTTLTACEEFCPKYSSCDTAGMANDELAKHYGLEEIIKYINLELKKTSFYEGICSIIIYGDGLVNYENIVSVVDNAIEKKFKVVTKTELGMKNLADISSLADVKEVYDRLSLIDEEKIEIEKSKEEFKNSYVEEINDENKEYEDDEKPKGFIEKIKKFLMGRY